MAKLFAFVVSSNFYAARSNCEPNQNIFCRFFAIIVPSARFGLAFVLSVSLPRKSGVDICRHGEYV